MKIRAFNENDREALRDIFLRSRIAAFHWLDTSAYTLNDFDEATLGEKIWVAENENVTVGFISAWLPDNFIHHLFVHPGFVNKGFGKGLLNACLAHLARPVTLKCLERNQKAITFYQLQGWEIESKDVDVTGAYFLLKKQ